VGLFKKTPKAPTAPDPVAVAEAQTKGNLESAVANANLNRIDQYTPEGSVKYVQNGTNPDGTPKYESHQTYSPEQQAIYDSTNKVSQALNATAVNATDRANEAMSKPWDTSGFTPLRTGIDGYTATTGYDAGGAIKTSYDTGGPIQRQIADAGGVNRDYASGGDITRGYDAGGSIQDSYASGGQIQKGLDYSGLDKIPGTGDYGAEAQRVQDAVYNQATSRLDPRFQAEQRQLASTLAAKGVTEGSTAYRNAMDQFARQKTDAYNQATYSGIQAGSAEQSRLFGLGLQGRQQGVSEVNDQGAFANSAQALEEGQNAARATFGNTAQGQRNAQNKDAASFANTAQAQSEEQNYNRAKFGNEAQGQVFGQNKDSAEFANAAQQQQYVENQDAAIFGNNAQAQQNSQNQGAASFYNTANAQNFGQNERAAAFNNSARAQQAEEAAYARNQPINDIAALMGTGGGVQGPQFQQYAGVNVAPTDYSGIMQQGFNNANSIYNTKMNAKNAALGAVFGAAGSAAGAAAASDRRLKYNIQKVGTLPSGINTYVYSYLGSKRRRFGVMADEVMKVIPEAIGRFGKYMTVDYGKVWTHGIAA
jgi:hypothetical protein